MPVSYTHLFVLFVDVLVVVSDVLAVGDVLTLGCYAVFNEPVRQLLQGRDGTAHACLLYTSRCV